MDLNITLVQGITIALALLGAVLGVINTWHSLNKSKLKLRVVPRHAIPVGGADPNLKFCIEITNLSAFAVSISTAGFLRHGTKSRYSIVAPVFNNGGNWPKRLEPRSSVTVYCQIPESSGNRIKSAFAETECGYIETGVTPALNQISYGSNP